MRRLALVFVFAASLLAASADAQWISGGTGAGGGSGTVTQVQTSSPLTGGPFTVSGTVGCATCDNSSATLTNNQLMFGAGGHTTAVGDLTGDITTSGGKATTLKNTGPGVTSCGDTTHSCSVTIDAQGRTTALSNNTISSGAGTVTHTGNLTLNAVVVGNAVADEKIDTGCSTDGAGAMTCASFATNGAATGTVAITNVGGAGHKITLSVNNPGADYTLKFPDTDASGLVKSDGSGQLSDGPLTGDVTTSGFAATISAGVVTAAKSAAVMTARGIVLEVGSPTGSALTTSDAAYVTVPFKCTISASDVMIDAADATVSFDVVRVATGGTALPSASILTGGFLAVASGTAVHNGNTTLFSSTAIAQNDRVGLTVHAANTAKYASVMIQCNATD